MVHQGVQPISAATIASPIRLNAEQADSDHQGQDHVHGRRERKRNMPRISPFDRCSMTHDEEERNDMKPASTDDIVVNLLRPHTLLDMRGGGPVTYAASRPPLGAGVLQWLEDSDHEAEEASELARRLNEQAILVDQFSPAPPSDSTNWPARDRPPPLVTGQNAGQNIVVCMDCFRDVATASIAGNRACCGTAICVDCAGGNCARCHPRVGQDVVSISLAQTLGQHREASVTSVADCPRLCNTLATRDDILRLQGPVEDEGSEINAWGHGSPPPRPWGDGGGAL